MVNELRPLVDFNTTVRAENSSGPAKRKLEQTQMVGTRPRQEDSIQPSKELSGREERFTETQVETQADSSENKRKRPPQFHIPGSTSDTGTLLPRVMPYTEAPPVDPLSDRTIRATGDSSNLVNPPWEPNSHNATNALDMYNNDNELETQPPQDSLAPLLTRSSRSNPVDEATAVNITPLRPTRSQEGQQEVLLISFDSPPRLASARNAPSSLPPPQPDFLESSNEPKTLTGSGTDKADAEAAELDFGGLYPPLQTPTYRSSRRPAPSEETESQTNVSRHVRPTTENQSGQPNYDIGSPRSPDVPLSTFLPILPSIQPARLSMPTGQGIYDINSTELESQMDEILRERGFVNLVFIRSSV